MKKKINLLELFGGVGAIREAYQQLGYEVASDYVEIDNPTVQTYNAMYSENFEKTDIKEYKGEIKKFNGVVYGSSCTDFSRAGSSKGGAKGSGTQSALIWEAVRIVEEAQPTWALLENVTDIINNTHKDTFEEYIKDMEELGYKTVYGIINSYGFNTAQTRKRLFAVHIKNENNFKFENIKNPMTGTNSFDFVEEIDHEYIGEAMKKKHGDFVFTNSKTSKLGYFGKDYYDKRVYMLGAELPTIPASNHYKINDGIGVRELTSYEMWKLQGFSDESYKKAASVTSERTLKRQAGNSICVGVLVEIIKELERSLLGE